MKINKIFKIIAIMLLLIILFPYTTITFAATVEEVGNAIATFAENYYDQVQEGSVPFLIHPYILGHNTVSAMAPYRAIDKDTGLPMLNSGGSGNYYELDCVGWVNFCIYNATRIEDSNAFSGSGGYVCPTDGTVNKTHFKTVSGTAKPGDIYYNSGHVMVCTRAGEAIDSTSVREGGPFKTTSVSRL